MLRWRLLGALAILGPVLALLWLDDQWNAGRPGIWTGPLALLIGLAAAQEATHLIRLAGLSTSTTTNLVGVFAVMACTLVPLLPAEYPADCPVGKLGWTLLGLALAVAILFTSELSRYRAPGESIERLCSGVFVYVYVGVLLSFLVQLRLLLPGRAGLLAVVATLLIVKLADTGAFFVGKTWGRTHFTAISPKKTVEGVVGGIAFAMVAAWFVRDGLLPYFLGAAPRGSRGAYLAYGASLAIAGLLGDLSESLLKRDVGQKDSSHWMRGLGGALDVVDSLLATAPVSYAWWATGWL